MSGGQYLLAVIALQRTSREVAAFFQDHDVWVSPTLAKPPAKLGTLRTDQSFEQGADMLVDYMPFTAIFNVTGQPAVSLPLHWSADGLPVGVQLVGRFGDEGLLYRVAGQLERARPWIDRKPPIWG